MVWLWIPGALAYLSIGFAGGIPVARYVFEEDRRRYPGLAADNPREGAMEAAAIFFVTLFAWPAVLTYYGIKTGGRRLIEQVVLPQLSETEDRRKELEEAHRREQQKAEEKRRLVEHTRELEQRGEELERYIRKLHNE